MSYQIRRTNNHSVSSTIAGCNKLYENKENDTMNNNLYENKDFYLSAYLMASGVDLVGHRRQGPISIFGFIKNNKVKQLVDQYYSMSGSVKPMQYGNYIRNLKNILHSVTSETNKELNNEFNHKQRNISRS